MSRLGPRLLAALAAAVAAFALLLPAAAQPTAAAWTDRVLVSATATAGDWGPPVPQAGCIWYVSGAPQPGATCAITGVTVSQWTNGVDVVRDYYVSVAMTGAAYPGYALVTVDLSAYPGGGAWTWGTAATLPTNQLTPVTGFACSSLPLLTATGPAGWNQISDTYWLRVVENRASPMGASANCL